MKVYKIPIEVWWTLLSGKDGWKLFWTLASGEEKQVQKTEYFLFQNQ